MIHHVGEGCRLGCRSCDTRRYGVGHVSVIRRVTDRGRRYDYPYQLISSIESLLVKDNSTQYKHRAPIYASAVPRELYCLIHQVFHYSVFSIQITDVTALQMNLKKSKESIFVENVLCCNSICFSLHEIIEIDQWTRS
jgi:hypothetical protein